MRLSLAPIWRKSALALALVILTSSAPRLHGQALPGQVMNDFPASDANNGDTNEVRQLVRILSGAYQNSLMHGSANADLETSDLLLENASIRFSARLVYELKEGSCNLKAVAQETTPEGACALDDPSLTLGNWSEMLSYAAYRLDNMARSSPATENAENSRGIATERIESMGHLYRMVFALSKSYFDRTQSRTYLDAAQEQLRLARIHMEAEHNLCDCEPSGYRARLLQLSEIDGQITGMKDGVLP
jgi:hypothetical protein